jgi:hypothetical protein
MFFMAVNLLFLILVAFEKWIISLVRRIDTDQWVSDDDIVSCSFAMWEHPLIAS